MEIPEDVSIAVLHDKKCAAGHTILHYEKIELLQELIRKSDMREPRVIATKGMRSPHPHRSKKDTAPQTLLKPCNIMAGSTRTFYKAVDGSCLIIGIAPHLLPYLRYPGHITD